jgi:Cu2+-exporting ATPase
VSSISYKESEILQMAAAVEKTALHPIARAIVNKAESLKLTIPVTRGQLTEPGFGTLAMVDGRWKFGCSRFFGLGSGTIPEKDKHV